MFIASYLLAAFAVILAWPVPVLLARASWPSRAPAAAMVLWQGIALAGGLSMIGAFLCWGLAPLDAGLIPAVGILAHAVLTQQDLASLDLVHVFALSLAALLFGHLVLTLVRSAWRLSRQRQRHREMLAFLSRPDPGKGAVVIDHDTPLAYCLPGSGSVTVLSSGLLEKLNERELRAVLAHESAHLDQRHDLLLLAFASWNDALPWLPTTSLELEAVSELVEELSDDAALRISSRQDLLGALAVVALAPGGPAGPAEHDDAASARLGERGTQAAPPASGAAFAPTQLQPPVGAAGSPHERLSSRRLGRLLDPQPPLGGGASRAVVMTGAALVILPTFCLAAAGWIS